MDLEKYVTVGEDGKVSFNKDAFTADLDRERTSAINTYSANNSKKLEDEIRKKLEEEAKLTAEEKLRQDREAFEAEKREAYKQLAQNKARTKLEGANLFDKAEIEAYLELVSDEEGISKVEKLISARTKYNETYEKSLKEKLLTDTPNPNGGNDKSTLDEGALFAKQYQSRGVDTQAKVTAFQNLTN